MTRTRPRTPDEARGYALIQIDSVFVGVVAAAGTFLPVFLVRLGASGTAVGLLTAIPAFGAFTLAIPFGRWLQSRRKIVPWYSRLRLGGWLSYGVMGVAAAVLPANVAVPVILAVWAAASLPAAAGLVAFPIVMDGAAGPHGRFDLLGRRWAISGVVTSITVVVAGQALTILRFPTNFEWLFVAISLAGVGSYVITRQIVLPDQETGPRPSAPSALARIRVPVQIVRANPSFVRFEIRSFVYRQAPASRCPSCRSSTFTRCMRRTGGSESSGHLSRRGRSSAISLSGGCPGAGAGPAFLPALLAAATVPATLSVLSWLPAVAAVGFVGGLAAAGVQLALFDELMSRIPRQHGVTLSSVDQSIQNFALIMAPFLSGLLEAAIGIRIGLLAAGAIGLGAFALFADDWWKQSQPGRHGLAPSPGTTELSNAIEPADGTAGNI
jgi:MFS family permease